MYPVYVVLSVLAGAALPLQALINGRLGQHIGGAVWAASVSFLVGATALVFFQLVQRTPLPTWPQMSAAPAWVFSGGFLGALYLASATLSVPRLGATALVTLLILGQLVASLLLDHFGVLAHEPHPASLVRIAGVLLVFLGAILVTRF